MKLLNKSFEPFLYLMLLMMLLSIPLFYFTIQYIYIQDANDSLYIVKSKLEDRINELSSDVNSAQHIVELLNDLRIGYSLEKLPPGVQIPDDRLYTLSRFDAYHGHNEPFRVLESSIFIHNTPFILKAEIDLDEYHDVIPYSALLAGFFFALIVIGFYLVNRKIDGKVWRPFLATLHELEKHDLNSNKELQPIQSDVEEFQKLSEILQSYVKRNSTLFQRQKEFIENASHELQTPLALLQSKTDVLFQTKGLTEEQSILLDEVKQIGSRMNKVNSNLLLLAKIDNNQFEVSESFHLVPIIESSIQFFSEWAGSKNIGIQLDVENNITLQGNKILAEIAIHNLIKNAIRYNTDPGHILIRVKTSLLTITNTSQLGELDGSKVFQRFFRTKPEHLGSGLGLAIVKEISDSHGWKVRYSFVGKRHSFTMHF
ncbi:sensor histidine kinase [Pleomorphovibrio marinus]|uniref:sensor histidine kinase n=1 Tax=Pleomorphovibrio marinus TaxID=2164132 RepID=UPI001300295B|nr:HAMP domain-containing sensor histidine kinase [Pleomorphovibrio marinus]